MTKLMDERYSKVEVVDRATGEVLVTVKVPGVPRNFNVFSINVEGGYDVEKCCRIAAVSAKNLSKANGS